MSSEETKKHWIAMAPSILTGLAALIAALTTVYINVRNDIKTTQPAVSANAAPAVVPVKLAVTEPKSAMALTTSVDLRLERVRVDNDGTMGTTDWTFDIRNGERSLFSVPFKALTDKAGANIVAPGEATPAHASIVLAVSGSKEIIVHGWKQAWSGKAQAPDVIGKAMLNANDGSFVVEATSVKAGGPAFVLYFNARKTTSK
jgi:hypothetical protein